MIAYTRYMHQRERDQCMGEREDEKKKKERQDAVAARLRLTARYCGG